MTGVRDPNRKALEDVASALGEDLLGELAFLGEVAVGLLVTDEVAPPKALQNRKATLAPSAYR